MRNRGRLALAASSSVVLAWLAAGCDKKPDTTTTAATVTPVEKAAAPKLDKVPRADFNRLAGELAIPIFWSEDKNKDGALEPDELAVYWGLDPAAARGQYVTKAGFSPKLLEAYERIAKRAKEGAPKVADPKENARREAVVKELAQGRITLVATDLSKASSEEKRFVGFVVKAAELVEQLYAKQQGVTDLASKVPADDTASKMLFFRGQGPKCEALVKDDPAYPNCSAIPDAPTGKISGMYPKELLANPKFCEELAKKDKALMDPFVIVGGDAKAPKPVPYTEAYKADMEKVAGQLRAAAEALGDKEPALKTYVLAAAQSFTDNKWWPADEAWAKMDAKNSKFYLRVGPDEVYKEPCATKALFHVSFGLINKGSLEWQAKLEPLRTDMEKALADLAGAPYKARDVTFKLPDFVDIALNAGDSRPERGATIGQSLPNFGPVANEGRGRTVVMPSFYTDADSIAAAKSTAESLFCKGTIGKYTTDKEPLLVSTILHEAAHNLGPAHQYKVNGKIDREAFGGDLASTLEELKAQTAALYFVDWLVGKNQLKKDEAEKARVKDVYWAFGHISQGMYGAEHKPRHYSQLSAIQLGWLMKNGAVAWKADETAANGKDKGCFDIATEKMSPAVTSLMTEVAQIKGSGNRARAEALVKEYVDFPAGSDKAKVHDVITTRMRREPKASFVYAITLDDGS